LDYNSRWTIKPLTMHDQEEGAVDFAIRFAAVEDLERVAELWVEFMGNGFDILSNLKMSRENTARWKCYAEIHIRQNMIKVAVLNGRIIGYILLSFGMSPFETLYKCGNILDIYIEKAHRRKGFGTILLHDGMDYLKSLGYQMVALNVLTENVQALRLYEREGFDKVFFTLKRYL
jgi:ribosomal protein S18 acetylase RimI-like enzyme